MHERSPFGSAHFRTGRQRSPSGAQLEGDIGVVPDQIGESPPGGEEEGARLERAGDGGREDGEESGEQVPPLLPAQLGSNGVLLQKAPERPQALRRPGRAEGDEEGVRQAAPHAVFEEEPPAGAGVRIRI